MKLNLQHLAREAFLGRSTNHALEKLAQKTGKSFADLQAMLVTEIEIIAQSAQQANVETKPYHRK
jgi:hypothetical protein